MIIKGYELIKEVVKNDGELVVKFHQTPIGKRQQVEYDSAMQIIHMVGDLINENTKMCEIKSIDKSDNNYIEMVFTKEAIKEVYDILVKEGVIIEQCNDGKLQG